MTILKKIDTEYSGEAIRGLVYTAEAVSRVAAVSASAQEA
ncbi:uncharacterized protein G2W53_011761 [Senna tora]|uniref:Uncharacterized protein n=1 Tax=Senna tora TaxID=362788 RepID=A0A834X222_9FABA|nr:uncharacterized protein G2W53_011761 [Senna tora]